MYQVKISNGVNLSALSQRSLSADLHQKVMDTISQKKAEGKHTVYSISESDFVSWNPKV